VIDCALKAFPLSLLDPMDVKIPILEYMNADSVTAFATNKDQHWEREREYFDDNYLPENFHFGEHVSALGLPHAAGNRDDRQVLDYWRVTHLKIHTIQAPYKKDLDKDGQPILGTRGGILLGI